MELPETVRIAVTSGFLLLIFLSSFIGNLFVFLVFYKKPILLTISNRFITSLSVCNVLSTIFVMPFMFASIISRSWLFGDSWCKATGFLMNTIFAASTLTLMAISIDRYCAVATPLHYAMRITSKRSVGMMGTVWIVAVLSSLPPLFGWNRYVYQEDKASCTVLWATEHIHNRYYTLLFVSLSFILPLCVILWAYIAIFKSAKNNFERTRKSSIVPSNAIDDGTQTPLKDGRRKGSTAPILVRRLSSSSTNRSLLWHKDEWKAAVTSLLVVSTFIICWFLYFIIIVLESVLYDPTIINPVLESVSILMAMSSFAFNPWVYVFRSKLARQELKCILGLQVRERDVYVSESRRGSTCTAVRDGIIRQSSTDSDVFEKPLHTSSTTTTLTSLVHVYNTAPMRL